MLLEICNFAQFPLLCASFFKSNYVQSHIRGKSKETMRKAYLGARSKVREASEETNGVGSVSALVIDGEKLVLANMGDYRAVVCKEGLARQIGSSNKQSTKKSWSHRFFRGTVHHNPIVAKFIHQLLRQMM